MPVNKMADELINLTKYTRDEGVYILSQVNNSFETDYLKVREKEKRIYSDSELILLPFASTSNPHKNEWDLRTKSFLRFQEYLKTKKQNLNLLDFGCGNGWFCGQLSRSSTHQFYCADINLSELNQSGRVFNSEKIKFMYADIFTADFPENIFDIITINAAIQYFPDLKRLLDRLIKLINSTGEIHIIDSPFYSKSEAVNAKKRTADYYSSIGFPEMAEKYFHHTYEDLSNFNYRILYKPQSLLTKMTNLFFSKDSPFPWIVINN
jgi:ubiquinone/menaquinone biosynthesis C-methylase UbiE